MSFQWFLDTWGTGLTLKIYCVVFFSCLESRCLKLVSKLQYKPHECEKQMETKASPSLAREVNYISAPGLSAQDLNSAL